MPGGRGLKWARYGLSREEEGPVSLCQRHPPASAVPSSERAHQRLVIVIQYPVTGWTQHGQFGCTGGVGVESPTTWGFFAAMALQSEQAFSRARRSQ